MTYSVFLLSRAQKQFQAIAPKDQKRITEAITALSHDPFRGKQLHGNFEGTWVIRVWPYRIIYTIEKELVTVTVIRIGHRKDVYR